MFTLELHQQQLPGSWFFNGWSLESRTKAKISAGVTSTNPPLVKQGTWPSLNFSVQGSILDSRRRTLKWLFDEHNPGYHSIHSRSLFQVFKELNYVHPNKMSQLFLISPHLRSWFQPKIGLQMLLPACVVPCVHLKSTLLFLLWYNPAYKYPGECGLHSAPKCPLCEVHSTGYKLFCSLSWAWALLR